MIVRDAPVIGRRADREITRLQVGGVGQRLTREMTGRTEVEVEVGIAHEQVRIERHACDPVDGTFRQRRAIVVGVLVFGVDAVAVHRNAAASAELPHRLIGDFD